VLIIYEMYLSYLKESRSDGMKNCSTNFSVGTAVSTLTENHQSEIWGSHSVLDKYSSVPRRDAVSTGKQVSKKTCFRLKVKVVKLFDPEEEGIRLLQNLGKYLPVYTAYHCRRCESSSQHTSI